MTIRPATPADRAAITAIARAAYAQYIPAIGREPAPMLADFASLIAADHAWVTGRPPQGFIVMFPRGDHMFLENLAVHPDATGQGLGRALIAFCEDSAAALGLKAVELYTNAAMTANQRLYPRLGYRETHRATECGFDRIYYRKSLTRGDDRSP